MTDLIKNRKYYSIADAADFLKCKPLDLIHLGANQVIRLCTLATGWKWVWYPPDPENEDAESMPSPTAPFPPQPINGPVYLPPWDLLCIEATGRATVDCFMYGEYWVNLDEPKAISASQVFIMHSEIDMLRASGAKQIGNQEKLSPKETNNLHCIIGALLKLMLGKTPGGKPGSAYRTQTAVIDALLAEHPGRQGISERNLEVVFAKGNQLLAE